MYMKNHHLAVFISLLVCSIGLIYPHISHAEKPVAYQNVCLKQTTINDKVSAPNWKRKLNGSGLPSGKPVYIVSMTQTTKGQVVTSGDEAVDKLLAPYGTKYVAGVMTYLQGGATMIPIGGNIEVLISAVPSYEPAQHVPVQYFAVYPMEPEATGEQMAGGAGALQQGTFAWMDFNDLKKTRCVPTQWDPEGRVFDAHTLETIGGDETIKGVDVTIYPYRSPSKLTYIRNPSTTNILGNYTFYVEGGSYELKVTVPNTAKLQGYTVAKQSQIHPNFSKVFYNIYKIGDEIIEIPPKVEHRDIALIHPTKRTINPFKVFSHTDEMPGDGERHYVGQLSHPLAKITVSQEASQGASILYSGAANAYGAYDFSIDDSLIDPQKKRTVKYEKVDITKLPLAQKDWRERIIGSVYAQQGDAISISTEPILQNVSGYAYDQQGKIIPNADVIIRIERNNAVAGQVKADEKGYFFITQGATPIFPYHFEFVDPISKKVIIQKTSTFSIKNNITSVSRASVSSASSSQNTTNQNTQNATRSGNQISKAPSRDALLSNSVPQERKKTTNKISGMLAIYIAIISILLIGGAGLFLYIKSRKSSFSSESY